MPLLEDSLFVKSHTVRIPLACSPEDDRHLGHHMSWICVIFGGGTRHRRSGIQITQSGLSNLSQCQHRLAHRPRSGGSFRIAATFYKVLGAHTVPSGKNYISMTPSNMSDLSSWVWQGQRQIMERTSKKKKKGMCRLS